MKRTSPRLPLWLLKQPEHVSMLRNGTDAMAIQDIQSPTTQRLIDDMMVSMDQAHGIGLAAPQIGQPLRLAIVAREITGDDDDLVLINPVITRVGTETDVVEEGCLSIPGVYGPVRRPSQIQVSALDRHGVSYTREAHGMFARVIQHELDHLNGRVFIDRVDTITKGQAPDA